MPSVDQLARLFAAVAAGDLAAAQAAAGEIAAREERAGHHTAAQRLRGSLHPNGSNGSKGIGRAVSSTLTQALTAIPTSARLKDVQLRAHAREEMQRLLVEWANRSRLKSAGLPRRSRLLFHGPPGCGKSVTAAALGGETNLPVYVVRFDAVVGAYLGQTAVHLRELFLFAETTPCILLIDEVDALGKHRGDPLDVGELHRIVITLMQELEHAHPAGFIVATSNLPTHLDAALWRRFDFVLEFPRPSRRALESYGSAKAKMLGVPMTERIRQSVRGAASFAAAELVIQGEARRMLLAGLKRS